MGRGGVVILICAAIACGRAAAPPSAEPHTAVAPPPVAVVDAGPSVVERDAGAELATSRLGCSDDLWQPGREWIEERSSSATSVGQGGYMAETWPGVRKTTQRVDKTILAMDGDAIARLRLRFEVDRDDKPTELEGKSFIVTAHGSEPTIEAVGTSEDDRKAASTYENDIAKVVPELTAARWRGDKRALADRLRTYLGWSARAANAEPPWGTVVVTPAATPSGALFADAHAFAVTGDGHDESAGLGHWSKTTTHVSGQLLVRPDGTLVELQLTQRSAITEGVNAGCGAHQASACPGHPSATQTTTESFRILCGP